jgi:(4S)-4-hydroxy-5-phosphonooxypentane-2,3-dione isomerase
MATAQAMRGLAKDRPVAYSFLSRFRIKPDREAQFVALARQMESLVDREPGTLAFKFFRLAEPGMFAVYESVVDESADKAHMETEHGKPIIAQMLECMDGSYSREMLYDLDRSS